jgi:hypothetical protein
MASNNRSATHIFALSGGTLTATVDRSAWPLDALCDFATRINPRRAFMVLSKVLGRHVPCRPSAMRASYRDLARRIPADLPGPVLVIGLAETAICLGQGVHEEMSRMRDDAVYLHSTRQQIDHPVLCSFVERHSHASAHLLYRPEPGTIELAAVRSLVLVDDEISSGSTLVNLANAVIPFLPRVETITAACLTDWSIGTPWIDRMPRPARCVSLLDGSLCWKGDGTAPHRPEEASFARAAGALGRMDAHRNFGRLGRAGVADEGDLLLGALDAPPGSRFRIICTGEFVYPPFRLAEMLEARGHDVIIQATTRSPILARGPIYSALRFADNYGTGVPNFLYNATPSDPRITLICHETPPGSLDPALIEATDGTPLFFGWRG